MKYQVMTDKEYAKIGGYRSTGVKQIRDYGMYDYLMPKGIKRGGDALDFGVMFHKMVLEPDEFKKEYVMPLEKLHPEFVGMNKNTKVYKEAKSAHDAENSKKIVLDIGDLQLAENMRDVVMLRYGKIIDRAKREVVFSFTDENGIKRSCKVDIWDEENNNMFDLKGTAKELKKEEMKWTIKEYGYDISYAWYYDVIKGAGGDPNKFGLLFSSKKDYRALMYMPTDFMLEIGRAKYGEAYEKILAYEKDKAINDAFIKIDPTYGELKAHGYVE